MKCIDIHTYIHTPTYSPVIRIWCIFVIDVVVECENVCGTYLGWKRRNYQIHYFSPNFFSGMCWIVAIIFFFNYYAVS